MYTVTISSTPLVFERTDVGGRSHGMALVFSPSCLSLEQLEMAKVWELADASSSSWRESFAYKPANYDDYICEACMQFIGDLVRKLVLCKDGYTPGGEYGVPAREAAGHAQERPTHDE